MIRPEKADEIYLEIMQALYKESEPSVDFMEDIYKTDEGKTPEFFMHYYLDDTRQEEIIDEVLSKHKLHKMDKRKLKGAVYLGCAPNGCKETWEEKRRT
jgi:hypothetical protein